MHLDFTPQFHEKRPGKGDRRVWVAAPLPKALMPVKTMYYRRWQQEECMRLEKAGEQVIALSHNR